MTQVSGTELPNLQATYRLRRNFSVRLFVAGMLSLIALFYASLVPFEFQSRTCREALLQFSQLNWLNLDVYRRADWIANGLVALPFSFFFFGAADRGPLFTLGSYLKTFGMIVFGIGCIFLIEFMQIWFPPRTVSGNDIAAGCIGVILGPILWLLCGRPALVAWTYLISVKWTQENERAIYRSFFYCVCDGFCSYTQ